MTDNTALLPDASPGSAASISPATQSLIMQLVVRRDLLDAAGWGMGPLMAQTAHAATAVLHETRHAQQTIAYFEDLTQMHKVLLQTANAESLQKLSTLLDSANPPIAHYLWVEQPDNIPTCLALAPNRKEQSIKKALDKCGCRLWKG
ncbi:hypothetical protein JAAARDRAFT_39788 [Jaapia argillacea MUCL 33604]|uniref:peptidyl-tRNA hydrolase n=1 Tax=Jaapia argillacea MUCL 33604 TaxID=933084 RepID=A0A067PR61_9AGAM|nr:hypothetical protein JAAARDRAFT_39788 [Jaapia argillacea MUCL 33604]